MKFSEYWKRVQQRVGKSQVRAKKTAMIKIAKGKLKQNDIGANHFSFPTLKICFLNFTSPYVLGSLICHSNQ